MSEQKERNNKIGARCLSDWEAELIMPTYKRIYSQIRQFRKEKESKDRSKKQEINNQNENQSNRNQDRDRKTNNIGIIGVRGAGKTSILKTIRARLMDEHNPESNPNDIILPIIVPENMSESGTLMATILGMLSEIINERDEKKRKKRGNTDCIRKTHLRSKCDEVIKQYTYIQKEYRDILISQYTTENDYVNRSAKVFNSDTEFITKFDELIDELINELANDGNQNDSANLLFLFIDDIDLSTYRCADVAKTLLSYLSNENIVTFISGDLGTFEESLALDFLRQENVLDKNILKEKIGNRTLLDSRKRLAYEYLKKIIPPAYRYEIKYWSLEERGDYCIEDLEESQREGKQKAGMTLSDLLLEALEGWVDPAFFCYAEVDKKEDRANNEKFEITRSALPYTYHLFDDTSRGLNNIYNVLNEIAAVSKKPDMDYPKEKKLLLDAIISSKPIYNEYRNVIQQNFYYVGATKADSRVFFDNTRAIIYQKDKNENDTDNLQKQEGDQEIYRIEDPVNRFSLFILVDFAARLLYEKDYEKQVKKDESYKILKDEAMKDLFFHPVIAGKIMDVSDYRWESKDEIAWKDIKLKDIKLKDINSNFLLKEDLTLNLAYYKNLSLDEMLKLYEDKSSQEPDKEMVVTVELEQKTVIAIWKAFSSIAWINDEGNVPKTIAKYYSAFWKELAYIRNLIPGSVTQNIVIRLFDKEINDVLNKGKEKTETEAEQRERTQMRRILSNTLARVFEAQNEEMIQDELPEIDFNEQQVILKNKEEKVIGKGDWDREDMERRVQILKIIDSDRLWMAEAADDAVDYLRRTVRAYLRVIKEAMEKDDWRINTSAANDSWIKFDNMYTGTTRTIAQRTRESVQEYLDDNDTNFQKGMPLETYRKVIEKLEDLAGNNLVWYGQSEAQQILNELQKASAEPRGKGWDTWIGKHSCFEFLLQCLYKYKMEVEESNNRNSVKKDALLLTDITKELTVAHKAADRQTLENFIVELNKSLKEKTDSEEFGKLFSLQSKAKQR